MSSIPINPHWTNITFILKSSILEILHMVPNPNNMSCSTLVIYDTSEFTFLTMLDLDLHNLFLFFNISWLFSLADQGITPPPPNGRGSDFCYVTNATFPLSFIWILIIKL